LDCFTGFGEMGRMTQFKDKRDESKEVSVGLFNYPVMMAADILLYGAVYVPVGDDQTQHLEYTRDIAERMNNRFGDIFTIPKPVKEQHKFFAKDQGLRIKDLANPEKKMSKSAESDKGVIFLQDSPETAKKKIMSATTDSLNQVKYDPDNQPGVSNLIEIYGLVQGKTAKEAEAEFAGQKQYGQFKQTVAETVAEFLQGFQARLSEVNEQDIKNKLIESEKKMNEQANATLLKVQKAVGLR
jgi:tryptophanyl-tRNA synthetase